MRKIYVNDTRTPIQRRVRYCFLRTCCGLNRVGARGIVGRRDSKIALTLENLHKITTTETGVI
jgi:hypothetical protein